MAVSSCSVLPFLIRRLDHMGLIGVIDQKIDIKTGQL